MTVSTDQDLFRQFASRGGMLLSSDGLFSDIMVKALAKHFFQPEEHFTSQVEERSLFSFCQQAIALAGQFEKLAPHVEAARKGAKPYPMGAITRLSGRLTCLALHPCLNPNHPKSLAVLNDFCNALQVRPSTANTVVAAVGALRAVALDGYRANAHGKSTLPTAEAVRQAQEKLEPLGACASTVGLCMGYSAIHFAALLDGLASGSLGQGKVMEFKVPLAQLAAQSDEQLLSTLMPLLMLLFGARGGWQEWRTDTKGLGEELNEFIPSDLASGVLMQWDGVVLLPSQPDSYKGTENPEFLLQVKAAHDLFKEHHRVTIARLPSAAKPAPDVAQPQAEGLLTAQDVQALRESFRLVGNALLSTEGLYRDGMVKAIVDTIPDMPASEFDNDAPDTALFNFYLHTIALAQEIDAVSGKLDQARHSGEDDEGNEVAYPMTDVSRIGALLTNLALHRAVEPFQDDRTKMLTRFCACLGMKDTSTVTALCNAVNWLRGLMVQRYRTFVQGEPTYPTHDAINEVRELLADMGAGGDYIGLALGFTIANLLTLMAGAESGKLGDGLTLSIKMSEEQANSFSDTRIKEVLLNTVLRPYFGARGGWQHWPEQDGDLGESFGSSIPAGVQGGVLMKWDDATLVPIFWDWYREHAHNAPEHIMLAAHRRWAKKNPICMAYYPLV